MKRFQSNLSFKQKHASDFSKSVSSRISKSILTTLAGSLMLIYSSQALAHGGSVDMVPLNDAMMTAGADVEYDSYADVYTITKNSTRVQIKPNSRTAMVNGQALAITNPLVVKDGQALVPDTLANELLQSNLDQTFKIEQNPHPLNVLSSDEIKQTVAIINKAKPTETNLRFSDIRLKQPDKDKVWKSVTEKAPYTGDRVATFTILKGNTVVEGEANLNKNTLTSWKVLENTFGMVLLDDFIAVQEIIQSSPEYAAALKKRGVNDVSKVVGTPLTVGYFGGKDNLDQQLRVLKIVSYLDVGDGNYWAHPIENLVAVVDLDERKIIKIEEGSIIPIPMTPRPIDGRDQDIITSKPLRVIEPEGKNYTITGRDVEWHDWKFHIGLDSRTGLQLSTVTFNDKGVDRKIMYQGNLGGMVVPYGDPDMGWYFKSYLDSGEYGMGTLTSPLEKNVDAPENAVLLDAVLPDYEGNPYTIPNAIAVFERYAGPEFKHQEMGQKNVSTERRELVVRWISTIGNYDYIFDWVFEPNGTIGIDAGATGIEAAKSVLAKTMHDPTAKEDTRFGTLIDHNIVGPTHQHIYNFRLDMDVDGKTNHINRIDSVIEENTRGGPRTSAMGTRETTVLTESAATENFDPASVRLISNASKENKMGNPVSYQMIPFAGGTHPIAKGANFADDEWLFNRLNFMDKQIWVTNYDPNELYPEGTYPNRSDKDTGLGTFTADNENIHNKDLVVWLTTGTTHIARAEEWPIMPTEWVNVLLKPWNFFNETPSLNMNQSDDDK
ncbi:primary-amine oxidase [uncultured Psychrobacter sp.]|uniref:primary-amine oxidase n=1 Tax=uncultured Psychrobacter sp. TaxID=259303 RepID=UPI00345A1BF1